MTDADLLKLEEIRGYANDGNDCSPRNTQWLLDIIDDQETRIDALRQVASGNHERMELIRAKYLGESYDVERLAVLCEMTSVAFGDNRLLNRILGLETVLRKIVEKLGPGHWVTNSAEEALDYRPRAGPL